MIATAKQDCTQHAIASSPERVLAIFRLRAEARALLAANGLITLQDAVDELWNAAEAHGLAEHFGVDVVQATLAAAFEPWSEYFRK